MMMNRLVNFHRQTIIIILFLLLQTVSSPIKLFSHAHQAESVSQQAQEHEHNKESVLVDAALHSIIISGLFAICWLTAPDNVKQSLQEQLTPSSLVLNFLKEYSSWAVATAAHETGHCLAQYAITKKFGTIHLGASKHTEKPIVDLGYVHIDGFMPNQGHVELECLKTQSLLETMQRFIKDYCSTHNIDQTKISKDHIIAMTQSPEFSTFRKQLMPDRSSYAVILLAGATSGIIAHHLKKQSIKPDHITIHQIINGLVPFSPDSDGTALWKDCAGISDQTISFIITCAYYVSFLAELYCGLNSDQHTLDAPLHSKLVIECANYFSRGFLRFHA